jgi:hypothetical protein
MDRLASRQLLVIAQQAGLTVSAEGGQLRIRGPKSAGHLAEALLERKEEVLDYLDRSCGHRLLLPESKALGRCLRCMSADEFAEAVDSLAQR